MKEPFGTITNVAFLVAAILILLKGVADTTALIAALTLLAMGSAAFHINGSKVGGLPHIADVGSLYIVAGVVVYHAWNADLWVLLTAMLIVGGLTLTIGKLSVVYPVGAATLIIMAGLIANFGWQEALLPLCLAVLGFVARLLSDKIEKLDDLLHGVWHVLIAAAVYTAWLATV